MKLSIEEYDESGIFYYLYGLNHFHITIASDYNFHKIDRNTMRIKVVTFYIF